MMKKERETERDFDRLNTVLKEDLGEIKDAIS